MMTKVPYSFEHNLLLCLLVIGKVPILFFFLCCLKNSLGLIYLLSSTANDINLSYIFKKVFFPWKKKKHSQKTKQKRRFFWSAVREASVVSRWWLIWNMPLLNAIKIANANLYEHYTYCHGLQQFFFSRLKCFQGPKSTFTCDNLSLKLHEIFDLKTV